MNIEKLKLNEAQSLAKQTTDVDVIIQISKHPLAVVRKKALIEMCPCRVKEDIDKFWDRVFEMVHDEDALVRAQVLHTICDGSPKHLEHKVIDAVEFFNRDSDSAIRRKAHKVLSNYSRTGKWNIL